MTSRVSLAPVPYANTAESGEVERGKQLPWRLIHEIGEDWKARAGLKVWIRLKGRNDLLRQKCFRREARNLGVRTSRLHSTHPDVESSAAPRTIQCRRLGAD